MQIIKHVTKTLHQKYIQLTHLNCAGSEYVEIKRTSLTTYEYMTTHGAAIVQPCKLLTPHARCLITFETSEYTSRVGTHMETRNR